MKNFKAMKPYILLLTVFLLALVQKNSAQDFGAVGTKWHYTHSPFIDLTEYTEIESIGDTMINGQPCHHLQMVYGTSCFSDDSDAFVYEDAGIVYYFVRQLNQFSVLYDFNLQVGDTLKYYVDGLSNQPDSAMLLIKDVFNVTINNVVLKKFTVQLLSGMWSFSTTGYDTLVERIGSLAYLFPQYMLCENAPQPLRCFEDSVLGFYSTDVAPSCDYIEVGINEALSGSALYLFPNPATDVALINLPGTTIKNYSLKIFDVVGNEISVPLQISEKSCRLDIASLSKGIYFVQIITGEKFFVQKLLKQ